MIRFINILFVINIFIAQNSYSQNSTYDSMAIKFSSAIRLMDSIKSPVPDSIRTRIVKYFNSNGLKPNEYYTTKYFRLSSHEENGYINLLRIGALRDLYGMSLSKEWKVVGNVKIWKVSVGAAGGDGDDILIMFDNRFYSIKKIVSSE